MKQVLNERLLIRYNNAIKGANYEVNYIYLFDVFDLFDCIMLFYQNSVGVTNK